jgi:hypothetical protein
VQDESRGVYKRGSQVPWRGEGSESLTGRMFETVLIDPGVDARETHDRLGRKIIENHEI